MRFISEHNDDLMFQSTRKLFETWPIFQSWISMLMSRSLLESLSSTRRICIQAVPWLNDNRGPEVVAAITIMTVLATIAVIMRYMARRISNLKFGMDDWLIVVALVRTICKNNLHDCC